MICFHRWGKVNAGYQYCSKCSKARIVSCAHRWQAVKETRVFPDEHSRLPTKVRYTLRCQECGDLKKVEI